MTQYIKAIKKSELADGEIKTIFVAGKKIMVAHIGREFFAIDDACTHAGCSLGTEGKLAGSVVTCGCHGGKFNAATGKVLSGPPKKDEQSYAVKVEGNDVFVLI